MPVKAPFFEAYLLHHRPDAARVTTALAERASGHGKNLLVVLRFVFRRVSHDARVRQYSNGCQGQKLMVLTPVATDKKVSIAIRSAPTRRRQNGEGQVKGQRRASWSQLGPAAESS